MILTVQPVFSSTVNCTGEVTYFGKNGKYTRNFCHSSSRKGTILEIDACEKNNIEMSTQRNEIEDCGLD